VPDTTKRPILTPDFKWLLQGCNMQKWGLAAATLRLTDRRYSDGALPKR
jgi:hypothetical protein